MKRQKIGLQRKANREDKDEGCGYKYIVNTNEEENEEQRIKKNRRI